MGRTVRIKDIDALKTLHRRAIRRRVLKYAAAGGFFIGLSMLSPEVAVRLAIAIGIVLVLRGIGIVRSLRQISKLPTIDDLDHDLAGGLAADQVRELVDGVAAKMNANQAFDLRIVPDRQFQAFTTQAVYKWFFKRKSLLALHEGLLQILSENELKAVVAHEVGHHLAPVFTTPIIGEYWADYFACKYYDPVSMANALIKLDQHSYLFSVYVQRCAYLVTNLVEKKYLSQALHDYIMAHPPTPFFSKRDANRAAKRVVYDYLREHRIPTVKRSVISSALMMIKNRLAGDILNRKKLSKLTFIEWEAFDRRIRNHYLDKYELADLYKVFQEEETTVSRFHFFDINDETHPSTNTRLKFIIENFILVEDASPRR